MGMGSGAGDAGSGRGVGDGVGRVDLSDPVSLWPAQIDLAEKIGLLEPAASPLSWLSRRMVPPMMPRAGWLGGGWAELAAVVERYRWVPDYAPVAPRFSWFEDELEPRDEAYYIGASSDPLATARMFVHDPSPAVGSHAWWEGEALEVEADRRAFEIEEMVGEFPAVPYTQMWGVPMTPEEDEAWNEIARRGPSTS